jgi:peptidoglycan biosynthesis protein MviN/MurJ (putative lipid II flippase)
MEKDNKYKKNELVTGIGNLFLSIIAIAFVIYGNLDKIWAWLGAGWFCLGILSLYRVHKGQPKNLDKRIKVGTISGLLIIMIMLLLIITDIINKFWLAVVIGLVAALAYSNFVIYKKQKE